MLGIDSSKEVVEYARSRYGGQGVRFEVADAARLKTEGKFDVAVAFEVTRAHQRPRRNSSDSAKRALKRGRHTGHIDPQQAGKPARLYEPLPRKRARRGRVSRPARRRGSGACTCSTRALPSAWPSQETGQGRGHRAGRWRRPDMKKKYLIAVCGARRARRAAPFSRQPSSTPTTFAQMARRRGRGQAARHGGLVANSARRTRSRSKRSGDGAEWLLPVGVRRAHDRQAPPRPIPLYGRALEREGFDAFWVHGTTGARRCSPWARPSAAGRTSRPRKLHRSGQRGLSKKY